MSSVTLGAASYQQIMLHTMKSTWEYLQDVGKSMEKNL